MSVLIKGMEMPTNCEKCACRTSDAFGGLGCRVTGYIPLRKADQNRPDFCPLVEVPSAHPEWIPCSERLPKEDGRYLGCIQNDQRNYIMSVDYFHRYKTWCPDDECVSNNVIAWMPLPEPPKDGE